MPDSYLDRKLDGKCTRCGRKRLAPDSSLCRACLAYETGRQRQSKKRRRSQRGDRCAFCPRKVGPGRYPSRPAFRCPLCAKRHQLEMRRRRPKSGGVPVVSLATNDRTWVDVDGRTRYHGQPRRGRLSQEVEDERDRRGIVDAIQRWADAMAVAHAPECAALGRGQVRQLKAEADARLYLVRRMIDDVLTRHRYTVPVIVDDEP